MTPATNEQAFEVGKLVVGRVNWRSVDGGQLQNQVIANPDRFAREFELFLSNGGRVQVVPKSFPARREVTIGPKSTDDFVREIERSGSKVSKLAKDIMSKPAFKTLTESRTLKLARAKVRDLGFTENPTTDQIWSRIRELGGQLCPPQVGPQLRKDLVDQPKGEIFWIAMEQITDSDGCPLVFYLLCSNDGERWLYGHYADPDVQWLLDYEIVFVLA